MFKNQGELQYFCWALHSALAASKSAPLHPIGGSSNLHEWEVIGTGRWILQEAGQPGFGGGGGGGGIGRPKLQVQARLLIAFHLFLESWHAWAWAAFSALVHGILGPVGPGSPSLGNLLFMRGWGLRFAKHLVVVVALHLAASRARISSVVKVRKQGPFWIWRVPRWKGSSLRLGEREVYVWAIGLPSWGPKLRVRQTWKNSFPCWWFTSKKRRELTLCWIA